jgi:ABC-type antimicrobial peptide transport system permease subunit
MGMPIYEGRRLLPSDPPSGDVLVVVSREMARRFWNGDAIGKRFSQGKTQFVVIGITGDVRDLALGSEPNATFYVSTVQRSPWSSMRVIARTSVPPSALADTVRKTLAAVDPGVPIEDVASMDGLIFTSLDEQRYRALLLAIMALVAALLASVGLYGALARTVTERRREIGVRLALGARPGQVMTLFLQDASRSAAGGALFGLIGTAAIARLSSTLLFGVGTLDLATVLVVCATAAVIVMAGGYFPVRRASRVDPAMALRVDDAR